MAFLEQTHLIGALDLGRALTERRPLLKAGRIRIWSTSAPASRRWADGRKALAELMPAGVRYVGVGVGKHWDRSWMKQRAENTGGYFTQINPDEPIAWRAFDLVATLNTPRLLHVQVAARRRRGAAAFLTDQASSPRAKKSAPSTRIGALRRRCATLPRSVVVTGVLDGQPYRRELPVQDVAPHADYLPRTWAKLEIDRLLAENAADNREQIVELSKAMYVMTPFTSLLVLENEAMYKEFKVDRGRKDHWAMYPCPEKIPVVFEPDPTQPIDVRNAPKMPKPVANLVLPTVVRRATPSYVGGKSRGTSGMRNNYSRSSSNSYRPRSDWWPRSSVAVEHPTAMMASRSDPGRLRTAPGLRHRPLTSRRGSSTTSRPAIHQRHAPPAR